MKGFARSRKKNVDVYNIILHDDKVRFGTDSVRFLDQY